MKTRNGFISNSSSSSYVVAVKRKNKCPHCGRKDPDFLDEILKKSSLMNDTAVADMGMEGILENRRVQWCWNDDELKNLEEKMKKFEEEWQLADIEISYHDTDLHGLLHVGIKAGEIEVLFSDEEDAE